jgi:hypothetical protein
VSALALVTLFLSWIEAETTFNDFIVYTSFVIDCISDIDCISNIDSECPRVMQCDVTVISEPVGISELISECASIGVIVILS